MLDQRAFLASRRVYLSCVNGVLYRPVVPSLGLIELQGSCDSGSGVRRFGSPHSHDSSLHTLLGQFLH